MKAQRRGGSRRRHVAAAVLTAAVILPAPAAHAGVETYFSGTVSASNVLSGPQHSMTSNRVGNNYGVGLSVGAAASSGSSMYGSWILGNGYACHPYGGSNVIAPLLLNNHSSAQSMFGTDYFGVDRYC